MGKVWKSFLGKIQNYFSDFLPGIQRHVTVTRDSTSQPYRNDITTWAKVQGCSTLTLRFTLKTTFGS